MKTGQYSHVDEFEYDVRHIPNLYF